MSTISKNEGPASSAEGGPRLELVLLFAAAVIFLYMGILLALYTATPGSKQYPHFEEDNTTALTTTSATSPEYPETPESTAVKTTYSSATAATTTTVGTTEETTREETTTPVTANPTLPETTSKETTSGSPKTNATTTTVITTETTEEPETTAPVTTNPTSPETTRNETTPKWSRIHVPSATTVKSKATETEESTTAVTPSATSPESTTTEGMTKTTNVTQTEETTVEVTTNTSASTTVQVETTETKESTVTVTPNVTSPESTTSEGLTEGANVTQTENTTLEVTTNTKLVENETSETTNSTVKMPRKAEVETPLVCLLGRHEKAAQVHLRDGLCDYVVYMYVKLDRIKKDKLWDVKNDTKGFEKLGNFFNESRKANRSKYLLSLEQNDFQYNLQFTKTLFDDYRKDKNIRGYGYALFNEKFPKGVVTTRHMAELAGFFSTLGNSSDDIIWFIGIKLRLPKFDDPRYFANITKKLTFIMLLSHTVKTRKKCEYVDPISSWSLNYHNDKNQMSLEESIKTALNNDNQRRVVIPSMSMATHIYKVMKSSVDSIESITNVTCENVKEESAEKGMCVPRKFIQNGTNEEGIVYAVNEKKHEWVTFENEISIQSKMRKANEYSKKDFRPGIGWALFDVDYDDWSGLEGKCKQEPFARVETIRKLIGDALAEFQEQ